MTFDEIMKAGKWVPIRNCPGRYKLVEADPHLSLHDLLRSNSRISSFRVEKARDVVLVATLDRGGLISYQRADGSFVHTLNTAKGFARKLSQLGIALPSAQKPCE
ncbi:MAG: hypothetical protein HY314_04855 [Acidobacteria bacterium]|nr:hypothetical protein [Acidobacteriota bacterium]